jgi:hypothetical protein
MFFMGVLVVCRSSVPRAAAARQYEMRTAAISAGDNARIGAFFHSAFSRDSGRCGEMTKRKQRAGDLLRVRDAVRAGPVVRRVRDGQQGRRATPLADRAWRPCGAGALDCRLAAAARTYAVTSMQCGF